VTDEERVQQQAVNENRGHRSTQGFLAAMEEMLVDQGRAHPEAFLPLRQSGSSIVVVFDEHEGLLGIVRRDQDGRKEVLHALNVTPGPDFSRPLDALLRGALEAVPLPSAKPPMMH
jgi:hypothetical protein